MNELSINIHIAGRVYPLTVNSKDEATLRNAGKLIQDKLQQYSEQFDLRDQQDALAMYALEIANENLVLKQQMLSKDREREQDLNQLEQLLKDVQL